MKERIGTLENPLALKTPPLTSDYTMHVGLTKDGKEVQGPASGQISKSLR